MAFSAIEITISSILGNALKNLRLNEDAIFNYT